MIALSETDKRLLLERADEIERWLNALPTGNGTARINALAEIVETLETRKIGPISIRHRGDVTQIHMLRIRAGSTSGLAGALRNWIAQARRKAGEA